MSIGSVSVDVVPDASGFVEKLKAKLADIKDVKVGVNLDTGKAKAELDKLTHTRRTAGVTAEANTKEAQAKLDRLAKTRTTTVRAKVDKSSFSKAESAASGAAGGMGALATAAIALGPALVPATAALVGLTGALAAGVAGAGGGLAIFGGLTVAALAKATKDFKAIEQLRKQATAATDPAKAAAYTKQANEALAALPKSERQFIKAKDAISKGFDELLQKSGDGLFAPLTKGSLLLGKVLPRLSPLVDAFGKSISGTIDDISHWADGKGFRGFIDYLSTIGVKAFHSLVNISKDVVVGVAGIVGAFTPLSGDLFGSMNRGMDRFAKWGQNLGSTKGFKDFLGYVKQVGPEVGNTLADIGKAALNFGKALAPQGGVILELADGLAKLVAKAKPGQLAAIAGGIGAIGLATGKIGKIAGLSLIVTSLSYADKHSNAFHKLADGARAFVSAFNKLPSGVKTAVGVAAGLGVVAAKVKGLGGGLTGGSLLNKVTGGLVGKKGVVPVFVTNAGFGNGKGIGGVGKPGTKTAEEDAGRIGKLLSKALPFLAGFGGPGLGIGVGLGFGAADSKFGAHADPVGSPTSGKINLQAPAINGPAAGLIQKLFGNVDKGAKKANQSTRTLSQSMRDVGGTAALGIAKAATRTDYLNAGLHRSGLGFKQYAGFLRGLPKQVLTKITTPGLVTTRAQVSDLAKKYHLTPKQVRTIVKALGIEKVNKDTDKAVNKLNILGKRRALPSAELRDHVTKPVAGIGKNLLNLSKRRALPSAELRDGASRRISYVGGLIRQLDHRRANPTATLIDHASGQAARIRGEIAGIHDKTATITVRTQHITTTQAITIPGITKPRRAAGGPVTQNRPYIVGEVGQELFVPSQPGYILNAKDSAKAMAQAPASASDRSGGPMSIEGVLEIPGLGKGYIRGVARDEISGHAGLAATKARASR